MAPSSGTGRGYVEQTGQRRGTLAPKLLKKLIAAFVKARFAVLDDAGHPPPKPSRSGTAAGVSVARS